jgi:ribosomal protein S18 acetylase RimI-like enzyme
VRHQIHRFAKDVYYGTLATPEGLGMHHARIERLSVGDEGRLRALRLRALRDAPEAFETTFEEANARPFESWQQQLAQLPTFVAVAGLLDVGMARGARHDDRDDTAYLISMWVAAEARGQGVGSALIDAVAGWARAAGFDRLLLDVAEGNAAAKALYTRTGCAPTGVVSTLPAPRTHIREIQMALCL